MIFKVYPPAGVIFVSIGILFSVSVCQYICLGFRHTYIFQVAKALGSSQDDMEGALAELFEHIKKFFKRLEIYARVPPTEGLQEVMVKVMVGVLSVLAIATKKLEQGKRVS
jgi:hypothetical protein